MRWKKISHVLGFFLRVFSALLLLPIFVGKFYGESFTRLMGFIYSFFISFVLSFVLLYLGEEGSPELDEAMVATSLGWFMAAFVGSIPYVISLETPLINAFFESTAGLTTTGASILYNVKIDQLGNSILFWRSFQQWIGGLGILTFFVTVISQTSEAASKLFSLEGGQDVFSGSYTSIKKKIYSLWFIYVLLTTLEFIALILVKVDPFSALNHSFTTISTGGFSIYSQGVAAFNSLKVELILILFMLLGGTNYALLFSGVRNKLAKIFDNYEFRLYLFIFLVFSGLISLSYFSLGSSLIQSARIGLFNTATFISSTGFTLQPLSEFPGFVKGLIVILMFIGGSIGSTAGGIKIIRFGILIKLVKNRIRSFKLPKSAVNPVKIKEKILSKAEISRTILIVFLWLVFIALGGLITVLLTPYNVFKSFTGVLSMLGSMGPIFMSQAGIYNFDPIVKFVWIISMIAGRLEIVPLLIFLNIKALISKE